MRKTLLLLLAALLPEMLLAQWVPCNKPEGAHVQSLNTFDNNLWVGSHDGGVYRSANNGQTWIAANNGLLNDEFQTNINCLHPMANKLLAGTAIGMFQRSTAAGPWTPTSLSMVQVLSMTDHNTYVMAGLYGYVARSTDGQTWTTLPGTGLPPANTFAVQNIASVQGTLIITTIQQGNGFYKSTNNGDTWAPLAIPAGVPVGTSANLLKVMGNRLFTHFYGYGIYYSDDAGQTWQSDIAGGSEYVVPNALEICNGYYVIPTTIGIRTRAVVGGTNWNYYQQNLTQPLPIFTTLFKENGHLFIGTSGEGMWRIDTMLTSFQKINSGLVAGRTEFMAGNGNRIVANNKGLNRIWSSTDNGLSWNRDSITNYYTNDVTSSTVNGNKWYIGLIGGINLSIDNGLTWRLVNTGLTNVNVYSMFTTNAGVVYAGTYEGALYRCTNDTAWTQVSTMFSTQENIVEMMQAGSYIFIGTQSAYSGVPHLYRSDLTMQNWTIVSTSWNAGFENVCGLAYQGNRLIAGSSGYGTFYSTDFGTTWDTVNTGLPPYTAFSDMKIFDGRIYATRDVPAGLYTLDSNSMEWECLTDNPGDPRAISVWVHDTTVFVGTTGNGVWKTHVPTSVQKTVNKKMNAPLVYPNPGTAPYIQLSKADILLPATVCVYDEMGRICYKETINTYTYQLKQPQLKTGNYIIEITDKENKQATVKWLKN